MLPIAAAVRKGPVTRTTSVSKVEKFYGGVSLASFPGSPPNGDNERLPFIVAVRGEPWNKAGVSWQTFSSLSCVDLRYKNLTSC